jgi:hypothetical protein
MTKSLRESRQYRKQAEMYRALALGEEPEGWSRSCSCFAVVERSSQAK